MALKKFGFSSKQSGPSLLILGAIHGNEKCGTTAINQWISLLKANKELALRGNVTFVPICNPLAYQNDIRYIDINLNRALRHHKVPMQYEEHLANELCPLIESHDYTLDLHSNHTSSIPFGFLDYPSNEASDLCSHIGIETFVSGWPELFHPEEDFTTLACAHRAGKISVTIECGQHQEISSIEVAFKCIENTLGYLGIIKKQTPIIKTRFVNVTERIVKAHTGHFTKQWIHMDKIPKGEIIAKLDNGIEFISPYDCNIFIPDKNAKIGDEWYYLAKSHK